MRKIIIRSIQIGLIPVICGVIGLILLAGAFLLPTGSIAEHVRDSVPMLEQETDKFSLTPGVSGTILDNYTEAIYLNEALINTDDAGLMDCILSGYSYRSKGFSGTPVETLSMIMAKPGKNKLTDAHKRFFNGYEVIVKLLLLFTDYSGIRQINLYAGLFLALLLIFLMYKRGLGCYIPALIVSLLFIRPLTLVLNMTLFGFYVCTLVPCILILGSKKEFLLDKGWLMFGITGAVTYYFNMNYIQLLSFAIPVIFLFLVTGLPRKVTDLIKTLALYFVVWCVGCVGMMLFKWLIYAIFIDSDIFVKMMDSFFSRTDVDHGSRFYAIGINAYTALGNIWWDILELVFIICALIRKQIRKRGFPSRTELVMLGVAVLLPLGRYLILSNHVIIHNFVTYRLLMIPVLTFNLLIIRRWNENGPEEDQNLCA